ncbi:MAG: hypothetical protein KatS3mg110_3350 [Pirellulaceae bacterium]|nr:MAG: hypothetical protein KatS3mg110_3350 [Pirellulaceae bacterium]
MSRHGCCILQQSVDLCCCILQQSARAVQSQYQNSAAYLNRNQHGGSLSWVGDHRDRPIAVARRFD